MEPKELLDHEKGGGPAFPWGYAEVGGGSGMTLRDYFAAHAPAMTDTWWNDTKGDGGHYAEAQASWAYFYADAMLKARTDKR